MKATIAALLAIVAVLAWLLSAEMATSRQLSSQLVDKTARENLDLQEKCALQAKKVSEEPYNKAKDDLGAYKSHYNPILRKCFVIFKNGPFIESLMDAYEQRDYATYMWYASDTNDKSNPLNEPKICNLIPSASDERNCKSYEEYKAFVATYME